MKLNIEDSTEVEQAVLKWLKTMPREALNIVEGDPDDVDDDGGNMSGDFEIGGEHFYVSDVTVKVRRVSTPSSGSED